MHDCGFKLSTANARMKIATGKDTIYQYLAANPQNSRGLSQAQALKFLSQGQQKRKARKRAKKPEPAAKPATDWVVFRNGIVNVLTGEMQPLSHRLWAHSALGFDWEPHSPCPTWERVLKDLFPDDEESRNFVEEFMGYCMTEETKFQKGAMLIGPKRSGKGTISHVLRQLVGDGSYVGLSFNTWTAGENSRECLIGKRVSTAVWIRAYSAAGAFWTERSGLSR